VSPAGARLAERLYLAGGLELYREYQDGTVVRGTQTLHVADGSRTVAVVETGTGSGDVPALRYRLGDHQDSSTMDLDENANLISYEEYHPYGTTAFQAGPSAAEVSRRRYRYTGRERDDESGLALHGKRYYAPWLGRWTSPDPLGLRDGPDVFAYVAGNPVAYRDPSGTSLEQNVLNELKDTFRQKGIRFAEEVRFYVLDASGNHKINQATGRWLEGRADLVWEESDTGRIRFLEGKGRETSPRTPNQIDYIPEFQAGGGYEIAGTKGGILGLQKGTRGSTSSGGFDLVHSGNLKKFISDQLSRFKPGEGQYRFVTVSAQGERSVKFFRSAEDLASFTTARGGSGTPGQVGSPAAPAASKPAEPVHQRPQAPKADGLARFSRVFGVLTMALDVYTAYTEIKQLQNGEDHSPDGHWGYGLGGTIINDYNKLPEGYSGSVIGAPHGAGFYEKKDGVIYKDGQRLQHAGT
jgi:RHS repeat-associated protein